MQAKPYATTDPGWPPVISAHARVTVFLTLTVLALIQIYAGWQGAEVSSTAREVTGTPLGAVTGAYQSEVNQTYYDTHRALGLFTWLIGMSGVFGISLLACFLSSLALIGAVPKWWARAAVLGAWILVSVGWQYVDLVQHLAYMLD